MLRAIAASAVVLHHVLKWPWTTLTGPAAALTDFLAGGMGGWGVSVFFVLSGTCIHLPVARELARGAPPRLDLARYFKRRLYRIYPPHAVSIFLGWLVAAWIQLPANFEPYVSVPTAKQFWAHVFLVHTFVPGAMYSINAVLWTIAIEFHFYVLYPLLLMLRRRVSMPLLCAGLFVVMLVLRKMSPHSPPSVMGPLLFGFLGRWWEWVLGAVIAERLAAVPFARASRPLTYAVILGSLLAACTVTRLPHGVAALAIAGPIGYGVVVWLAARIDFRATSLVDRALHAIGMRSYSLYLTHPISLTLAGAWALGALGRPWLQATLTFALAFPFAWAYFALIERRFLTPPAPPASAPVLPPPAEPHHG